MDGEEKESTKKNLYLYNKVTNERYILNGDLDLGEESDNASLVLDFTQRIVLDSTQLPPKVDLRPWMTEVESQTKLKTCTANAVAGAYEYLYNRTTGQKIDVSRLFIYYNSRMKFLPPGVPLKDSGSSIIHALEVMFDHGVCLEEFWQYDRNKVNCRPPDECYDAAQEHRIIEALQIDLDLNELRSCLAQGYPILVSINLFDSFDKAKTTGIVPIPKQNEGRRKRHGRHAILLAGYSDRSQAFIARNSWGKKWGKEGYCYIPYDYILNPKLTNYARTVKRIDIDTLGEVGWCMVDAIDYTNYPSNGFEEGGFGGGGRAGVDDDNDHLNHPSNPHEATSNHLKIKARFAPCFVPFTVMASSSRTQTVKNLYLVNKRTNRRYVLNGEVELDEEPANEALAQDFTEHMVLDQSDLPRKVDLRPWMTAVEDQSTVQSCTANAMAGAYEYLYNKATGRKIDVSRLFVYYNSRMKNLPPGGWLTDSGSAIVHAIQTMSEIGVCLESMWSYDRWKVNQKPSYDCYKAAQEHMIVEALKVDLNLIEIKTCLAQGFPIIISINVFKSFDDAQNGGVVPLPRSNEVLRQNHGRHAVLLAGYSDSSHAFIVRNSWGTIWGDKGYCYIPYEYLTDRNLTNYAWTVKKLNVESLEQVGWCNVDAVNYTNYRETDNDNESNENEGGTAEGGDGEGSGDIEEIEEDVDFVECDENDGGDYTTQD